MSIELYDVAVIGYGPTGAVAATILGQAGYRVLVADKATEVYARPRALSLDHEIMRLFQSLGLADKIAPFTAPFTESEHYGVDGQLIRNLGMVPPPYPMGWTPSMVFNQPGLETVLRNHVATIPTVDVRLGMRLTALTQTPHRVSLEFEGQQLEQSSANARYVIGCDGASSTVRELAGIELNDLGFDEPWLVVDVLANDKGLARLPKVSAQFCDPTRPVSYLIGTQNHRRWEIMLNPNEDRRAMEQDSAVWRLLSRWLAPDDGEIWRRASYRFHALVARDWRCGRVFLAGDAAHQQPPFLGQGMCQGLRDVTNLSWKLDAVFKREAPDSLLDTYGSERAAHVCALTTTIKGIGRTICERDLGAARARDRRLIDEAGGVVKPQARQDLVPGLTVGLLSDDPTSARGVLFPQPRVDLPWCKSVLLDELTGATWRIVLYAQANDWTSFIDDQERGADTDLAPISRHQISAYPVPFHLVRLAPEHDANSLIECDGVVASWMTKHDCLAAVVRPDHYVYGTATTEVELTLQLNRLCAKLCAPS